MQFFHFGTGNQLIQQINSGYCMQYSDSVERVFVSHDIITQENYQRYSAILSCTPNGTSTALADFALTWGSVEIAGTTYWGFYCYLSSLYTQVSGPMACNLVVSNLTQVIVSQTFSIMVNAASSSTDWSESINQAQWKELMNYVSGLKIPNLGTVNFVLGTSGSIIDNYYGSANAGAYYFTDTNGVPYLLFVSYASGTTTQTLYYVGANTITTSSRTYVSAWGSWSTSSGYLPLAGGTMLGPVNFGNYSSNWVNGTNSAVMNPTYLEFATSAGTTMYEYGEILFNGFAFKLPTLTADETGATEEWVDSYYSKKVIATNAISNGDFQSVSNWTTITSSYEIAGNVATITPTASGGGIYQQFSTVIGHKIFVSGYLLSNNATSVFLALIGAGVSVHTSSSGVWTRLYGEGTATQANVLVRLSNYASTNIQPFQAKYITCVDLTVIFGAGNEPTASEFDLIVGSLENGWINGSATIADTLSNCLSIISLRTKSNSILSKQDSIYATSLLSNGDFSNGIVGWNSSNSSLVANGDGTATMTASAANGNANQLFPTVTGHIYYAFAQIQSTASNKISLRLLITAPVVGYPQNINGVQFVSVLGTATATGNIGIAVADIRDSGWDGIKFGYCGVFDLTALFGAGKEPSKSVMDGLMAFMADNYETGTQSISGLEGASKRLTSLEGIGTDYIGNPLQYKGSSSASVFNNIACVGDSLTSGTFNYVESGVTKYIEYPQYSYPTFLTKIIGSATTNYGVGGQTFQQWYDSHASADLSGHDCVVIILGTNDINQGVATATSITYLGNIISLFQAQNSNIKVFVCTTQASSSWGVPAFDSLNNAIREYVATQSGVFLIDLARYSIAIRTSAYEKGHMTAIGYQRVAQEIANAISLAVDSDPVSFKWVQFIGTTHSGT